jgi:hypothetical protein
VNAGEESGVQRRCARSHENSRSAILALQSGRMPILHYSSAIAYIGHTSLTPSPSKGILFKPSDADQALVPAGLYLDVWGQ